VISQVTDYRSRINRGFVKMSVKLDA